MADEQDKVVAPQTVPLPKGMRQDKGMTKGMTTEQRRIQDALEDDDVRESLKELHVHKVKSS